MRYERSLYSLAKLLLTQPTATDYSFDRHKGDKTYRYRIQRSFAVLQIRFTPFPTHKI